MIKLLPNITKFRQDLTTVWLRPVENLMEMVLEHELPLTPEYDVKLNLHT